jgi:molybdate/tungstate transport system ATP-binding protein
MLKIDNLSLKKGSFSLNNISFEVQKNSYFVILGKTGSGKTMLLESIAGIQEVQGDVYLNEENITHTLCKERNFGFVYQDFILFPNMNVKENIIFASRYKKIENSEELLEDLISFLCLENLLNRNIKNLSGGEKQRVAIARAIYSRPKVLLLDEPLSAIDPTLRNGIMKSLKEIVKRYDTTVIHVTHNFREAFYLSDNIAIMGNGKILQVGKSKEVLNYPKNIEVAKFLGFKNIFNAKKLGIQCESEMVSIDPNQILFSNKQFEHEYCFACYVKDIIEITDHYKVYAYVKDDLFFVKVPLLMFKKLKIQVGKNYNLCINKKDVVFI